MTRVKICGIRRMEDARLAVELGASAIGIVFWPSSPRFLEPECAVRLVDAVPPFVTTVGVFVDQPFEYVADVARQLKLGAVQLHGQEPLATYAGSPVRVIKAVPVGDGVDAERAAAALPGDITVLLDAHDPIKRGGTGRTIDWSRAASIARQRPVILSGGLHADNVHEAIGTVRPSAIDVSSGVELAPGVKDPDKLRSLFRAVGRADGEREQ
ncbi:MAG TPA: phosphoribosylanthranilate isomerase [Vicinamibacterales bacterium]|jgi:phosphoribosylanthranilate isomerase